MRTNIHKQQHQHTFQQGCSKIIFIEHHAQVFLEPKAMSEFSQHLTSLVDKQKELKVFWKCIKRLGMTAKLHNTWVQLTQVTDWDMFIMLYPTGSKTNITLFRKYPNNALIITLCTCVKTHVFGLVWDFVSFYNWRSKLRRV